MKNYLFLIIALFIGSFIQAQTASDVVTKDDYKVVIQLTSADTNVHKTMVKQLGNLLAAAPNTKIEVVCHSAGLDILRTKHTVVYPKLKELNGKGVKFVACENTLKERKISKEEIIPESGYVKAGILEVIMKQEEGWSYIRAGQ
jgi:uncharacterized protein